jgi:hypothetical protein
LKILNNQRRERHQKLKNQHQTEQKFNPGELVINHTETSQVQGKQRKTRKVGIETKGTVPSIRKSRHGLILDTEDTPVLQEINRRKGKRQREAAMRMEKIPLSVVIHKRIDTMDTRFAKMKQDLVDNPLEQFFDFGKYHKTVEDADYAFVRVSKMRDEPIKKDSSEDESLESESKGDENEDKDEDPVKTAQSNKKETTQEPKTRPDTWNITRKDKEPQDNKKRKPEEALKNKKKKVYITEPLMDKEVLKQLWKICAQLT